MVNMLRATIELWLQEQEVAKYERSVRVAGGVAESNSITDKRIRVSLTCLTTIDFNNREI